MKNLNTKRKGALAVSAAINYFISQNLSVFVPVADCDKYDLVVNDGILKKVQCKYTSEKSNTESYAVRLFTFGGYRDKTYKTKYINNDFELLFVYCSNGDIFLIPGTDVIGKSEIVVSKKVKSPWVKYLVKQGRMPA